jgi:hypothetical protein
MPSLSVHRHPPVQIMELESQLTRGALDVGAAGMPAVAPMHCVPEQLPPKEAQSSTTDWPPPHTKTRRFWTQVSTSVSTQEATPV